jgi:microcystin-dependent protein
MIKKYLLFIGMCMAMQLHAQTGIGTTTPNASAKLDVYATNKGFLPPRVTLTSATDASTIASPAEGLLVYNLGSVGLQSGYYYWNGTSWATIATASSAGNGVTATDLVKLYGEGYSTAAGKIAHANGFSFTVPVSGRYLFDFTCSGYANGATSTMTFSIRQGTSVLASDAQTGLNNTVHVEYNGKVEVNLSAGTTYNVYVSTTGVRDVGDYDRVYYKMVAGNLPVTGQSVDYIQASLSANQTLSAAGNIIFNTSSGAGITLTSGGFNLTANKTYKLEAALGGASSGYGYYAWVDPANALLPGGSIGVIMKAGTVYSDAPQDKAVVYYTPTVNTTVYLRVLNISGTVTAYAPPLANNYSSTWASIQQVGSSAFVNPWVLSGTTVYNTTGKVGIGNNAPTTALDVTGDTKISGVLTAGGNTYPTNTGTSGYALTTNAAGAASWNSVPPVGVVTAFAGSSAPAGYLLCDGAAVSRTTYSALFAIIGTTYGAGNGSTTFNIPDLTGRIPVGKNSATFSTLGAKGGEENHTMTINEMPAHKHSTSINSAVEYGSIGGYAAGGQSMYFGTDRPGTTTNWNTAMQNTGGGAAFNVIQPYTVLNYIIKY